MRRAVSTFVAISLLSAVSAAGLAPVAIAAPGTTGGAAVDVVAARQFTATGTLGRYYTKQTVTGTFHNRRGHPTDVTVYNYQGVALVTAAKPKLDTTWWGSYWHDTYGLDQWYVGTASGDVYHFMLPTHMGSTFSALLVTEFDGGSSGNWQNWMDGTST